LGVRLLVLTGTNILLTTLDLEYLYY